jgi:hypothetical protein
MNAAALSTLIAAFNDLDIRYSVVGSVASSAHGIVRGTLDTDLLALIVPPQGDRLAAALGKEWYADPEQIRDAIEAGRAFNLIHVPTGEKFDVFPATEEFHTVELERAAAVMIPFPDGSVEARVSTAEDILLAKLRWYALGGQVSDRQWGDITGILAVNRSLDFAYLGLWAKRLGVSPLLEQAVTDAND